ncbi:cupin domain-containing protein [Pseudarthrobacter scleromae]|uniref:cupin domain-containing protein n=1 Tax=Pseudarthrobacter scleromae TaxID=158897 RepID=UPI00362EBAE6
MSPVVGGGGVQAVRCVSLGCTSIEHGTGLFYELTFNPILIVVFGFLVNLFERGHTALAYASSPEVFDTAGRSLGTGVPYGLGRLSNAAGPQAYRVPLDELVGAPEVGDPRIRLKPRNANGRTVIPLTRQPGGMQAWKIVIPTSKIEPVLKTHEGYEWLYVLSGRMRLVLGDHDLVLGPGEVAEFDTHVPHWFGSTGDQQAEVLSVFGGQVRGCTSARRRTNSGTTSVADPSETGRP